MRVDDGRCLGHCVDVESMGNRVYFPFLEPALTEIASTDGGR